MQMSVEQQQQQNKTKQSEWIFPTLQNFVMHEEDLFTNQRYFQFQHVEE